ncbi:hypothetical protein DFH07DRAFT_786028, partial [Mycena maculata]
MDEGGASSNVSLAEDEVDGPSQKSPAPASLEVIKELKTKVRQLEKRIRETQENESTREKLAINIQGDFDTLTKIFQNIEGMDTTLRMLEQAGMIPQGMNCAQADFEEIDTALLDLHQVGSLFIESSKPLDAKVQQNRSLRTDKSIAQAHLEKLQRTSVATSKIHLESVMKDSAQMVSQDTVYEDCVNKLQESHNALEQ